MVKLPPEVRRLYPFEPRRWKTAPGASMSFVDVGPSDEREAVLLLHGNPTWSFYYRNVIGALQGTRRCIAPDHVGMGLSEKPEDYRYTLQSRIDDVAGLVDHLELSRIDLVVHDWGGAIGFGLAARMPERIRRISILNTAAFPMARIPARIALCKLPGPGTWAVRGLNAFAGAATWMAMHRRRLTEAEQRGYLCPYDSWSSRVAVDAFVKDIPLSPRHVSWSALLDAEQGVARMREHPVQLIWGGQDFCFNDRFYEEWLRRLPGAETLYLPDAGHYVLEDAAEEVVPRLARFLS